MARSGCMRTRTTRRRNSGTIYDRKEYDALRAKYMLLICQAVYDKVKVDIAAEKKAISESWVAWLLALFWSIWPLTGLYGVFQAVIGGDYLLPRESMWSRKSKEE